MLAVACGEDNAHETIPDAGIDANSGGSSGAFGDVGSGQDAGAGASSGGAGNRSEGGPPAMDAGSMEGGSGGAPSDDASAMDSSAAEDAGSADAATPNRVASGAGLVVWGVTDDDYVVYFDGADHTFYSKSLDGGEAVALSSVDPLGYGWVNVFGKLVFVQTWGSHFGNVGHLTQWSSDLAAPVSVTSESRLSFTHTVWGSQDGAHVVYARNLRPDGALGALYGIDADGENETLLAGDLVTEPSDCLPTLRFTDRYAIASYCKALEVTDAGAAVEAGTSPEAGVAGTATARTIEAFSLEAGWASTLRVDRSLANFVVDPGGDTLVTASAATGFRLQAFPLAGGAPGPVLDPDVAIFELQSLFSGNTQPWFVVYNTVAGAVRRAYVEPSDGGSSVDTLVESGVGALYATTTTADWIVGSSTFPIPHLSDIRIVSTRTPDTQYVVATMAEYNDLPLGIYLRPPELNFTRDDEHLVFYSELGLSELGAPTGYLNAIAFQAPQTARRVSAGLVVSTRRLAGSQVLMVDNYRETPDPTADLTRVDLATSEPAEVLESEVNVFVMNGGAIFGAEVSRNGQRLVFSRDGRDPGIYWTRIP